MEPLIAGSGWLPDPAGRHQFRYHDGWTFTGYVSDNGVVGVEAVPDTSVPPEINHAVPSFSPPDEGSPRAWPAPPQPSSGYNPPSPGLGTFWPAPAPPQPGTNRRVGLIIVSIVAVLEGIAIIALTVALLAANTTTSQPIGSTVAPSGSFNPLLGTVVYSSNFASDQHWPTGSLNANTSASLSNGEYVVHAWTYIHHPLLTPYSVSHPGISVEAKITDFSSDNVSMGVGCQSAAGVQPALVYQLVVYPNGQWYIEEARVPGAVETLASGYTSALATTGTVQLTCVITDTTANEETTQLVAYVNDTRVGGIGDQIVGQVVGGYIPILLVGSYGPRVQVAFNQISVRSINPKSVNAITLST